jgi:hypothetical protein
MKMITTIFKELISHWHVIPAFPEYSNPNAYTVDEIGGLLRAGEIATTPA